MKLWEPWAAMSLADEVLAEHKQWIGLHPWCVKCGVQFPCKYAQAALALRAAEQVVEVAKKLQRDYEDEVPAYFAAGNLGHCHANPPLWDDPKRGSCGRCSAWMSLTEALAEYDKEAKGE